MVELGRGLEMTSAAPANPAGASVGLAVTAEKPNEVARRRMLAINIATMVTVGRGESSLRGDEESRCEGRSLRCCEIEMWLSDFMYCVEAVHFQPRHQ